MFLTRTSCHKITHTDGYYGGWSVWAVSISVLPLTVLEEQTFLILVKANLSIVSFMSHTFDILFKTSLPNS